MTTVILSSVFLLNASFIMFYTAFPQNSWMFWKDPLSRLKVSHTTSMISEFDSLSYIPSPLSFVKYMQG